jgi:hypothetical protein
MAQVIARALGIGLTGEMVVNFVPLPAQRDDQPP